MMSIITLDDLASTDPDRYERIWEHLAQAAIMWCQNSFQQSWAEVNELGTMPIQHSNGLLGYRVVIKMPDHPAGEIIEVVVTTDWEIKDIHLIDDINSR